MYKYTAEAAAQNETEPAATHSITVRPGSARESQRRALPRHSPPWGTANKNGVRKEGILPTHRRGALLSAPVPTAGAGGHSSLSHAALSTRSTHAQAGAAAQRAGLWGQAAATTRRRGCGWGLGFFAKAAHDSGGGGGWRPLDGPASPSHRRVACSCCLGQTARVGRTTTPAWACQQKPRRGRASRSRERGPGCAAVQCWREVGGAPAASGRSGTGTRCRAAPAAFPRTVAAAAWRAAPDRSESTRARFNCHPTRKERPRTVIALGCALPRTHGRGLEHQRPSLLGRSRARHCVSLPPPCVCVRR